MPKVLVSDALSQTALDIFKERGISVTFRPDLGKDKAALAASIHEFDGLAIRSTTKVTEKLLGMAENLKVVGRAGIGVDNIDIKAATRKGVTIMNTPFGNSITTAEHALAMMLTLAREIPFANESTHLGKWEKSKFMGVEVTGKTLGLIGAGNIGAIVADRANALKMNILAYDPYLSEERAGELGVWKVEFEELLAKSDFITLHVPKTDETKNLISETAISKMKPGVRIINCARGGLVDEAALAKAITSGHVAGAAFDVFAEEPATKSPLLGLPNVVLTPHLGASTREAQEKVALQVAEQMSDFLNSGAVVNAINMPAITSTEAKTLIPFIKLSGYLGAFIGQLTSEPIEAVRLLYNGAVAEMNVNALNSSALAGLMRSQTPDVNMVSAPLIARERGIKITTSTEEKDGVFESYIKLTAKTTSQEISIAGTVFSDGKPRFIQINGINIDAAIGAHMLYTTNNDTPGIIGTLGSVLGENNLNIANFTLGRSEVGGEAIALLYLDETPSASVLEALKDTGQFTCLFALGFDT